jgi:hypothetical protein
MRLLFAGVLVLACLALAGSASALDCVAGQSPLPAGQFEVCLLNERVSYANYSDPSNTWSTSSATSDVAWVSGQQVFPGFVFFNDGVQGTASSYEQTYNSGWGYSYHASSATKSLFVGADNGAFGEGPLGSATTQDFVRQDQSSGSYGSTYPGSSYDATYEANGTTLRAVDCTSATQCLGASLVQSDSASTYSYNGATYGGETKQTSLTVDAGPVATFGYGQVDNSGQGCQQYAYLTGFGSSPYGPCPAEVPQVPMLPDVPDVPPL